MKRLLAFLALLSFFVPFQSFAITQWLTGSEIGGTTQTGTSYAGLTGATGFDWSGSEIYWQEVIPIAGTFSNFSAEIQSAPGAGNTLTFTVRKNNVDTAVTCAISGAAATTCQDLSNSFTVVAGDAITLKSVTAGSPGGKRVYTALKFVGTNAGESFVTMSTDTDGAEANNTTYSSIYGARQSSNNVYTTSTVQTPQPTAGTYSNLYVRLADTADPPGTGNAHNIIFQVNNVDQFSCTIAGSSRTCSNTTGTVAVVAGDLVNYKVTGTSSPVRSFFGAGMRFVPTTDGESVVMGTSDSHSGNGTVHLTTGGAATFTWGDTTNAAGSASTTYKNLYVRTMAAAPGGSASRTFFLANDGVSSTVQAAIVGTATSTFNTTSTTQGVTLQWSSLMMTSAGTPAASDIAYGFVQYTPEAGATSSPAVARRRQPLIIWIDE